MCSVENAERRTFQWKAENSWFHPYGQQKRACDINRPVTPNGHMNQRKHGSGRSGKNISESRTIQGVKQQVSRAKCSRDRLRTSQRASAYFAEVIHSKSRTEYRRCKVTSINKQTEQRCGVQFGAQEFATALFDRMHQTQTMNLFFRIIRRAEDFLSNEHVVAILLIFDTSRTDIQRYLLMSTFGHLLFVTED